MICTNARSRLQKKRKMTVENHIRGLHAEFWAGIYFRLKGYRVLKSRFKTQVGEIDLILKKGRVIVFTEVKLRKRQNDAAEAVHGKNRARVTRAAELYLQQHPEYTGCDARFDALVMTANGWPRHIQNAWAMGE